MKLQQWTRWAARVIGIAIAYLIALWVAANDYRVPGYGHSQNGDNPIALVAFFAVAVILWRAFDKITE